MGNISTYFFPEHYYDTPQIGSMYTTHVAIYDQVGHELESTNSSTDGAYLVSTYQAPDVYIVNFPAQNSWVKIYVDSEIPFTWETVGLSYTIVPGTTNLNPRWNTRDYTNVMYHINKVHNIFKASPFNYSAMD
ncbi:MAG TPA: hypothetical protein VFG50_14790, partial [Rhodothermales bacterium]|nr:hypothetical protein [Rhodothermales bacterium]